MHMYIYFIRRPNIVICEVNEKTWVIFPIGIDTRCYDFLSVCTREICVLE